MAATKSSVRLLPIAERDLVEAIACLAAESPAASLALSEKFEAALSRLCANPRLGRVPEDARLSGLGYRFIVLEDFLVFYTVDPGLVLVHRIVHGARDLRRIL